MSADDSEHGNDYKSDDYIARSMLFLAKYQWVYDFQLTNFLCNRVWERIPAGVRNSTFSLLVILSVLNVNIIILL